MNHPLFAAIASPLLLSSAFAATFHVSPGGNDAAVGTAGAPVETVRQAIALAYNAEGDSEIILHAGRYQEAVAIGAAQAGKESQRLSIVAADGEIVVFDMCSSAGQAQPHADLPGVYLLGGQFHAARMPDLWESDTRVRYIKAADPVSVRKFPGSFALMDDQTLAFSTSDGKSLRDHDVRIADGNRTVAILCWRSNVTIRGLRFENCSAWRFASALDIRGKNVQIEDCSMVNCVRAIQVGEAGENTVIRRCVGEDVGGGVYINGKNTTVEHCRFIRATRPFEFEMYPQDNSGIQYYAPAEHGVVRFNICSGFCSGIFIKGAEGNYRIEHNTITDSTSMGIYNQAWRAGNVIRFNLVYGGAMPVFDALAPGVVFDRNLLWNAEAGEQIRKLLADVTQSGMGSANVTGDPLLADPERGDFRPSRTGPVAALTDADGPAGALPFAPDGTVLRKTPAAAKPANDRDAAFDQAPAALAGAPVVQTTARGAAIAVSTDHPAACTVEVEIAKGQWDAFPCVPAGLSRWHTALSSATAGVVEDPEADYGISPRAAARIMDTSAAATVCGEWLRADTVYNYRVRIRNRAGNETVSQVFTFTARGPAHTLYVSPDGRDAEDRGAKDAPYATLQFACNRLLPGDVVRLLPGVYTEGAQIYHGGMKDAQVIIEADQPGTAIIDSMKSRPTLVNVFNSSWITLRNLELRWFKGMAAIVLSNSPHCAVTGCRIWNDSWGTWPSGIGIFFRSSPDCAADHNTIYLMEHSMFFYNSPGARVTHNTTTGNMYSGLWLHNSARDSVVRNNAFCWSGNVNMQISGVDNKDDLASLDIDYNNYAGTVREAAGDNRPRNNLVPRFRCLGESKGLIEGFGSRHFSLESWQKASGKDMHSLYADPLWVNPLKGRFNVAKNSPNIGAGENGTTIGAQGYLGEQ